MKPILDMCCGSRMFYFDKSKPNGTLIFKWNDIDIPLANLYSLFPSEPVFGQKRPKNKKGKYSHWLVFMKY